jgi:hypothetical protein
MRDQIVDFLRRSGCVPQSVEALSPKLDRWERHLRLRGVDCIPQLGAKSECSPTETCRAHNEMSLLMQQAASQRKSTSEHELRNLTGIRPYKP